MAVANFKTIDISSRSILLTKTYIYVYFLARRVSKLYFLETRRTIKML